MAASVHTSPHLRLTKAPLSAAVQQRQRQRIFSIVSAEPDKARLAQQVKDASQSLTAAGDLLKKHAAEQGARAVSVAAKEEALWARQEAWIERETQRWEKERDRWAARESALLDQIASLQDSLVRLAELRAAAVEQSTSSSRQATVRPPQRAQAIEQQPEESSSSDASVARPTQPRAGPQSVVAEASQFLPEEDGAFAAPSAEEFTPLKAELLEDDPDVERVRNSLQSAFSAIDTADVLSSDYDSNLASSSSKNGSQAAPKAAAAGQSSSTPPLLKLGADDIFWMSQLHNGLIQANFYPGEEEMEDWYFGEQTQSAVLSFQAAKGVPETGLVDDATWRHLLGSKYGSIAPPEEPEGAPSAEATSISAATGTVPESVGEAVSENGAELRKIRDLRQTSELENRRRNDYTDRATVPPSLVPSTNWPALREGDGGKDVHHLHVALERKGFIADVEDQRWWFFGSSTNDCVLTFQACSGLPESGCVEEGTWHALLSPNATPAALNELTNEFEDDMTDDSEAVWLLGEQRWARRRIQLQ